MYQGIAQTPLSSLNKTLCSLLLSLSSDKAYMHYGYTKAFHMRNKNQASFKVTGKMVSPTSPTPKIALKLSQNIFLRNGVLL